MRRLLDSLAQCYRQSAAGSGSGARDFIIEYEKFLRLAGMHDGDDRELAEAGLRECEVDSRGALVVERDRVTRRGLRLRLTRAGGEDWLFARLGVATPTARREETARSLDAAAGLLVPDRWRCAWRDWFHGLARQAMAGAPIPPFRIGDSEGNQLLLKALRGVLGWKEPTTIRYASAALLGDSKLLQSMETRLGIALLAITGDAALEAHGILPKPRHVAVHGPLEISHPGGTLDLGMLPAPVWLADGNITAANRVHTSARFCLIVENEDVFFELAKSCRGILLVQSSYPGAAVRRLLAALPAGLPIYHFGDSDPAGFDILRDLREKSGRAIAPVFMGFRPCADAPTLSAVERDLCQRLLANAAMADVAPQLQAILAADSKGSFEQESLPLAGIVHKLAIMT